VVLSNDIMRVPPSEILKTTVMATIVGGKIVYGTSAYEPSR
jgi:predicted amidohydrolase YtcJ